MKYKRTMNHVLFFINQWKLKFIPKSKFLISKTTDILCEPYKKLIRNHLVEKFYTNFLSHHPFCLTFTHNLFYSLNFFWKSHNFTLLLKLHKLNLI